MEALHIYSWQLTVYPKGDKTEIERFRAALAEREDEFTQDGGIDEYDPKRLHFSAMEAPADPDDIFAGFFEEFESLSFLLGIKYYVSKYESEGWGYAVVEKGGITETDEAQYEWDEYGAPGGSRKENAETIRDKDYKNEVGSKFAAWLGLDGAESWLLAAQENGSVLDLVPEALWTEELVRAAHGFYLDYIRESGFPSYMLQRVPAAVLTGEQGEEISLSVIEKDGAALEYLPAEARTAAVCLAAVKQNGKALDHVPDAMREEIAQKAGVPYDPLEYKYMDYKDSYFIIKNRVLTKYRDPKPRFFRGGKMAGASAVGGFAVEFPRGVRIIGEEAFRECGYEASLSVFIPEGVYEIEANAFGEANLKLVYIPDSISTVGQYAFSDLNSDEPPMISVPAEGIPDDNNSYLEEANVVTRVSSEAEALEAVRKDGLALGYMVSESLRTVEVCLAAFLQNSGVGEFFPEALEDRLNDILDKRAELGKEAVELGKEGKSDEAIEKYRAILELCPEDSLILNNLGWEYYKKGRYDEAIPFLDRAITANPGSGLAYDSRGDCYFSKGDFARAAADFKKAHELAPDNEGYKANLAKAEAALK